ncbi:MAG: hypothetical protein LAO23_04495 [Acidobacteriia bacterium]|nr:hypothetical protein [Terriglobia bacterium]
MATPTIKAIENAADKLHEAIAGTKTTPGLTDAVQQVGQDLSDVTAAITGTAAQPGLTGTVAGAANQVTHAMNAATAFPILTEEVSYPPSPLASPGKGGGAGGGSQLGQMAMKAIADVLGWKPKVGDPKGFVGALNASFSCQETEGRTECVWTPRTYAVQTDIGGGITGAQASVYTRSKDAIDESLKLLDGLYPLRPDADDEFIQATREIVRNQMTQLVVELGMAGGPRVTRVDQIFLLLTGVLPPAVVQFDPDLLVSGCQLATLRRVLGLRRQPLGAIGLIPAEPGNLVNTVEDETDQTNFRIIVDYVTSLQQSWNINRPFFQVGPGAAPQAFFGTQLVLISQQMSVVVESVDEVRFALDSMFIGPDEQQTVLINFALSANPAVNVLQPMFVDRVLSWIRDFAAEEGPRIAQEGGTFGIGLTFIPILQQSLIPAAAALTDLNVITAAGVPSAFNTPRVLNAANDLQDQLDNLLTLAQQIQPPPF